MLMLTSAIIAIVAYRRKRKNLPNPENPLGTSINGPFVYSSTPTVSNTGSSGTGSSGTGSSGTGGSGTGGSGTGGSGTGSSNGFVITGVGQVVTGANPKLSYHTVAAPARVINVDTTPDGNYPCSVTINNHTESFTLNSNPTGYPAIYFNPADAAWGITAAGVYLVTIVITIGNSSYTQTTSTAVTNQDLGISGGGGGPIDNSVAVSSSVRTDLINVVKDPTTGLYSDTTSDNINGYVAYYFLNGVPYLNTDGSRKKFENEAIAAGRLVQVAKLLLHPNYYSSYADWLANGWKTKIKVGNDYPNDWWVLAYAEQDITTA